MRLPLFPLHIVLAPGVVLPLHVFEERYRLLVQRCLDSSTPFGIVLIREGSEVLPPDGGLAELSIAAVGTFAEIREASRFADGRWNVEVVGTGRFGIRSVDAEAEPYLVADVEPVLDVPGDPDAAADLVDRVRRRFVEYLRLIQPRNGEPGVPIDVQVEVEVEVDEGAPAPDLVANLSDTPDAVDRTIEALRIPDDPVALSYLLTGIVQVEPDRKQQLLEAATAEARLMELDDLLARELLLLRQRLAIFQPSRRELAAERN